MTGKKIRMMCIFILCFLLLSGGILATVEIKTANGEPLIDLDKLLVGEEIGQPGSENAGSLIDPADGEQDSDGEPGEDRPAQETKIEISVSGKTVRYKGKIYTYDRAADNIEGFDEILRDIADQQIILMDRYAEAHAYKYVLEKIRSVIQDDSRIVRTMIDN